jgi:hypothetical protein
MQATRTATTSVSFLGPRPYRQWHHSNVEQNVCLRPLLHDTDTDMAHLET